MSFELGHMRERHATEVEKKARIHGYNNWAIVLLKSHFVSTGRKILRPQMIHVQCSSQFLPDTAM
jgi:hypothetical protein